MSIRSALLIILSLVMPASVQAETLWKSGFETGNLSEWSGTLNPTKDARQNIVVVDAPLVAGKKAAELTIHPDDLWPGNDHNRVELRQDGQRTKQGETTFFSWYFMLHDDAKVHDDIGYWETSNSFQQSMALYVDPSANGTTLGFRTNQPSSKEHFKRPLSAKVWHQLTMKILWSTDPKLGRVSIWLDGTKVADEVAAETKLDDNNLFIQVGFHRNATALPVETISIDEAIEGTTLDDVLMKPVVVPDAGVPDAGGMPVPPAADAATPTSTDASAPEPDGPSAVSDGGVAVGPGGPDPDEAGSKGTPSDLESKGSKISGGCHVARDARATKLTVAWLCLSVLVAIRRRWRGQSAT